MIGYVLGGTAIFILILFFAVTFYCYKRVFFSKKRRSLKPDEYDIPEGETYENLREQLIEWVDLSRNHPCEKLSVTSFDGLTLRGRLYEYDEGNPSTPIEIMFNGYRGNSERDMSGGVARCFSLGRSALIVNQRACGDSDGSVISFGINERRDCLKWVELIDKKFEGKRDVILTGISMGAATVIMASAEKLPESVKFVIADCPFSSAKEIIYTVMQRMGLPPKPVYPFVKLGAKIFGRFNLEETSPIEAVKKTNLPIFFVHGKADGYIPYEMSQRLSSACKTKNTLVLTENADHGVAYPVDKEGYITALKGFEKEIDFKY